MFMYSYCYVCSNQGILFHCVVLCIVCVCVCVCVYMSNVLLSPGVKPTAVNKYIVISFHMSSRHEVQTKCRDKSADLFASY